MKTQKGNKYGYGIAILGMLLLNISKKIFSSLFEEIDVSSFSVIFVNLLKVIMLYFHYN